MILNRQKYQLSMQPFRQEFAVVDVVDRVASFQKIKIINFIKAYSKAHAKWAK